MDSIGCECICTMDCAYNKCCGLFDKDLYRVTNNVINSGCGVIALVNP
jgi:hypothetical protein